MRWLRAWIRRFGGTLNAARREREMAAEFESNLQLHIDDNIAAGMPPAEARRQALLKFGPLEAVKDQYRDRSGFPLVTRVQLGTSSRVMLVKEDGTVIAGPGVNLAMKRKSNEFAAVRDSVGTISGQQPGFVVADLAGAQTVIGFADTGLKQDYGNLGWVVLAAQDTYEAFAPIRTVNRIIAFMSLVGLLAVTLFGVWFFMHRTEEFAHIGTSDELTPPRTRPASA